MATLTAVFDQALSDAPEWGHLMPLGRVRTRDGRTFVNDAPRALVADVEARAIDDEHQNDTPEARRAGPVPAAGWIKALDLRADGLWGRVAWTERARRMIAARAYRFLGPSMLIDTKSRRVTRLNGAGLVHNPARHLTALAREDLPVTDTMTRLARLLGLPEDTEEDAIWTALEKALKAGKGAGDPHDSVPAEAYREALSPRQADLATARQRSAEDKVARAMREGHITPAAKAWARDLCLADAGRFDAFLAASPAPHAHLFRETHTKNPPPWRRSSPLRDTDAGVETLAAQLGVSPDRLSE